MSFLAIESILIDHLKAKSPAGVHVLTRADLASVTEGNQPTPAIHVINLGYKATQKPHATIVEEDWLTVVAVRNVRDVAAGRAARSDAAEVLARLLIELDGLKLAEGYQPLRLVSSSARPGYSAGHAYYPLQWRTSFHHMTHPSAA